MIVSYKVDGDGFKKPIFLISTDIELNAKTIIEYSSKRWAIETNYKYLKANLGFDKYKVHSLLSIERYFLIIFLAINFLEIFKIVHKESIIKSLGEAIQYQRYIYQLEILCYISIIKLKIM